MADKRRSLGENKQLVAEIHKLQEEIAGLKQHQATLSTQGTRRRQEDKLWSWPHEREAW